MANNKRLISSLIDGTTGLMCKYDNRLSHGAFLGTMINISIDK